MMRGVRRGGALAWLALASACALSAPPADQVLEASDADARSTAALAAFRAAPEDVDVALEAARALFAAVDVTVQRAFVEAAEGRDDATPADVLAAEDEVPAAVVERVLGLANAGLEAATAARDGLAVRDEPPPSAVVEAEVLVAQHLSFLAWANGPARSLLSGYGSRITAAMDRALERDATWNHGAPLRLKGRFLAEAPWVLRDRERAVELLRRAVAVRSMPIHHLFLGDVLFDQGDVDAAREQWRLVGASEPDATTAEVAAWHRRLAAARLGAGPRPR